MALAIATVPGQQSEGVGQLLDSVIVELNSTSPAAVIANLQALIGPNARVDGVSIYNGGSELVRVTALDAGGQPVGFGVNASGQQLVNAGHTIQFGLEDVNLISSLTFESVTRPASVAAGQAVASDTLVAAPASSANQFVYVNLIEQ